MSDKLIDVTPLLEDWKTTVRLTQIELTSTARWRWLRRALLRDKIDLYEHAIGAVYAQSQRMSVSEFLG